MVFFEKNKYAIIGGLVGLILAILLMTIGFFKTLLALIFVILGVCAGIFLKQTGIIDQFIDRR
ncbi:hypothetical protein AT575_03890 [Streptococcus penaeicida]|uniref:DUF2273 domain-containing protein n=2 Tax=Streptococcus TaxID=1301 RepID=A0A2N8LD05_9STRE|nr:DUF2273 domain-containing protein [Streptococcus penaeicida]PND48026.1 hypothetical protein AT575_03890 [Streptococcus penaeicida]